MSRKKQHVNEQAASFLGEYGHFLSINLNVRMAFLT